MTLQHDPNDPNCMCDTCCETQARERERDLEGYTAATKVADYVNGHEPRYFVAGMARQHRTLQATFTRMVVGWIEHLAALPEGCYDGRNHGAVVFARAITATDAWKDFAHRIPYV